nr:MAG TPA: hypothetical protein [Caudoviricetes sp.]
MNSTLSLNNCFFSCEYAIKQIYLRTNVVCLWLQRKK